MKPYFTVKKSEWDTMPEKTKQALAQLAKAVSHLTKEQIDKIKDSKINECGCQRGKHK